MCMFASVNTSLYTHSLHTVCIFAVGDATWNYWQLISDMHFAYTLKRDKIGSSANIQVAYTYQLIGLYVHDPPTFYICDNCPSIVGGKVLISIQRDIVLAFRHHFVYRYSILRWACLKLTKVYIQTVSLLSCGRSRGSSRFRGPHYLPLNDQIDTSKYWPVSVLHSWLQVYMKTIIISTYHKHTMLETVSGMFRSNLSEKVDFLHWSHIWYGMAFAVFRINSISATWSKI